MRAWLIAAATVFATGIASTHQPAAAGPQRWCYQNHDSWYVDCSEPSFESCIFSTLGNGGHCYLEEADRPTYRAQSATWRAQSYAEEPHWNWGQPSYRVQRAAYAAPSYNWGWHSQSSYYQPTYYQPSYYQPTYYQPSYYQPSYMNSYPVNARPGGTRWCYMNGDGNGINCSQPSFEMCLFSTFGTGGYCYQEQAYLGPSRLHAAALRAHRVHNQRPAGVASATDVKPSAAQAFASAVSDSGNQPAQTSALTGALAEATVTDAPLTISPVRAATPIAAPRDLPKYNVEAACRRMSQVGVDTARDTAGCLQDEHEARDQLVRQWNTYSGGDRASCTRMTGSTGGGTYTELVTCLDMGLFARGGGNASTLAASR